LDIASLLYTPEGKPRHSVFYIAHLNDDERMFFVTLLFSAVEAWMRSQSGTPSLRSLLYFDEIFGYLPPIANPPSKPVILRMLKQARAFGVGLVLATQNPADVDYKGLSNTGTWFIGKLQTDQDKQRLLDGLEGAMTGSFDRKQYDRIISGLGKRVFLMHNVHETGPIPFQTRWAMNYLAGPLTRSQIPALNALAAATAGGGDPVTAARPRPDAVPSTTVAAAAVSKDAEGQSVPEAPTLADKRPSSANAPMTSVSGLPSFSSTRPSLPPGVAEYFLPVNLTFTKALAGTRKEAGHSIPEQAQNLGLIYQPTLFAQASIRFLNRKYDLDIELNQAALVRKPDGRGLVRWKDYLVAGVDVDRLETDPDPEGRFTLIQSPLTDAKVLASLKKDFQDWVFHESQITVRANEKLEIYASPDVTQAEFRTQCSEAARRLFDAEAREIQATFKKRLATIEQQMSREQRELAGDQADLDQRKMEEWGTHAENLLSMFGGRRRKLTTSLSKRRMTSQAKQDVEESLQAIKAYEKQIAEIQAEQDKALQEAEDHFAQMVNDVTEVTLNPLKKDILLEVFGLLWQPFFLAQADGEQLMLPATHAEDRSGLS
jgi:hypothetical protein